MVEIIRREFRFVFIDIFFVLKAKPLTESRSGAVGVGNITVNHSTEIYIAPL